MAEDREDFSDGTRPPRGPRANRLGHPETRPLSTEDRADCAPVGSAKVVHDKPNAGADTPREPRRDRERNLSERPSEGAVVASNNPQPQSRRKRSPRSRSGKLTSPISSSDELPAKRQRSRIDRDAWGSQYYDDGPEGDLAKHADDRSGGTDQLLPSPRSGWRQDRRFRPNKGSRDNSEADFIASATRPYDRYEPVADRDWSDGKNLFDSVAASNRDSSRPQRSPSRGGRVLNRKEGSHYRGMGQPLRGEPPDQEARPMQAVRGSGWKTVQAPARSSGKLGRSPADSAGVKGGVNGSNRSRLSHDSEQSCQADNRPPGSGTRSAALPHPSSAGPHLDLPADSRTDSLPSSSSAHPRAGTNPDEEREIAAPGSRSKCERRDDNGEQRLDLPQVEAGEGYVRIGQVGEGTYGQVFKARSDRTGVLVALKKIRMEAEKDGFPITAMREIKLLQELRHENIVRLHEMMVARSSVYMVFEYMEHDLNGILAHPEIQFSPAHFKSLSAQLFSGLAYLHRKSVLHRDLKGSNILINNQGLLKLADFGLARFYMKRRRGDYTNRVVTLWYRPPELLFGATQYGPEVDMWGAGCIFLELFTKRPAFPGNTEVHQLQVISDILGPITEQRWPGARKLPWFELVKPTEGTDGTATSAAGGDELNVGSVHTSPKPEGSYFDDAFSSWLPPSALEVARRLLSYDPLLRLSAADALEMDYFGEAPRAEMPAGLLSGIEGEWHEFESRRARKKSNKRAPDTAQADAPAAHMQARSAAMGTGDDRLPEPADA